jgi:YVTN family beta-propeller protein
MLPAPANCSVATNAAAPTPPPLAEAAASASQILARIPVTDGPAALHVAFGSVWTVNHRSDTLSRIDPATNKVAVTIPVESDGNDIGIGDMSVGAKYIWVPVFVGDAPQLWRLDPSTNQFDRRFPIESLEGAIEVNGALWVDIDVESGPAKRGAVEEIDPDTGNVLKRVDLLPARSGLVYSPSLAYGDGTLWVPIANDAVARVDLATTRVVATIATPAPPSGYGIWAFIGDKVFLTLKDYRVARIDPSTNCIDSIVYLMPHLSRFGTNPVAGPMGLITAPQGLYVGFDRGALALVNPGSMSVVKAIRLDEQDYIMQGAYGYDAIWFSTFGNNSVLRLRPFS